MFDNLETCFLKVAENLLNYTLTNSLCLTACNFKSGIVRRPDKGNIDEGDISYWVNKLLKFLYSNVGYIILGLALERAAHKPYIQLVEDNIFKPLEFSDTYFIVPGAKMKRLAVGIEKDSTNHIQYVSVTLMKGYGIPSGGIYSTPMNLVRFLQSQIGINPILSDDNLNLIH